MYESPVNSVVKVAISLVYYFFHQRKDTIIQTTGFFWGTVFLLREIQTESCFLQSLWPFRQILKITDKDFFTNY